MSQRRSGFDPGFSKAVEAILIAEDRGHLYPHEVRANLRLAGMHLDGHIEIPDFEFPKLEDEPAEPDTDPTDDDYEEGEDG